MQLSPEVLLLTPLNSIKVSSYQFRINATVLECSCKSCKSFDFIQNVYHASGYLIIIHRIRGQGTHSLKLLPHTHKNFVANMQSSDVNNWKVPVDEAVKFLWNLPKLATVAKYMTDFPISPGRGKIVFLNDQTTPGQLKYNTRFCRLDRWPKTIFASYCASNNITPIMLTMNLTYLVFTYPQSKICIHNLKSSSFKKVVFKRQAWLKNILKKFNSKKVTDIRKWLPLMLH